MPVEPSAEADIFYDDVSPQNMIHSLEALIVPGGASNGLMRKA